MWEKSRVKHILTQIKKFKKTEQGPSQEIWGKKASLP